MTRNWGADPRSCRCGPSSNPAMVSLAHDGFEELWHQTPAPIGDVPPELLPDRPSPTYNSSVADPPRGHLVTGRGAPRGFFFPPGGGGGGGGAWPFPRCLPVSTRPAAGSGS